MSVFFNLTNLANNHFLESFYFGKLQNDTKRSCSNAVTIVEVDDSRVPGDTWVKVGHQRSDVLGRSEHPMDHVPCVDETCGTNTRRIR